MTVDDRLQAFRELERLVSRISGAQPALMSSLGSLRRLLEPLAAASWEEHDAWLLHALGDKLRPPGPLAAGLLALRLGKLAKLKPLTCLDLAEAGFHSRTDPSRLAKERLRSEAGGGIIRAEVPRLLECRAERLDGSGPLGLSDVDLDAPTRLFAAACAFVEGSAQALGGLTALAFISARSDLFGSEVASGLLAALSALPLGSYVELASGAKGRVVGVRADFPLRPKIRVRLEPDGRIAPATAADADWGKVVKVLSAPELGAPAPHESAKTWLWRVHRYAVKTSIKIPPPLLPPELTCGWHEAAAEERAAP